MKTTWTLALFLTATVTEAQSVSVLYPPPDASRYAYGIHQVIGHGFVPPSESPRITVAVTATLGWKTGGEELGNFYVLYYPSKNSGQYTVLGKSELGRSCSITADTPQKDGHGEQATILIVAEHIPPAPRTGDTIHTEVVVSGVEETITTSRVVEVRGLIPKVEIYRDRNGPYKGVILGRWVGIPNQLYQLQESSDLISWKARNTGESSSTGTLSIALDTTAPAKFFRWVPVR